MKLTCWLECESRWKTVSCSSVWRRRDDSRSCREETTSKKCNSYDHIAVLRNGGHKGGSPEAAQQTVCVTLVVVWVLRRGEGVLTEGCGHGRMLQGGLMAVSGRQVRPGEVSALLVVVLDVQAGQFGEADPQGAATVVDVLSLQRLKHSSATIGTPSNESNRSSETH